MLNLISENYCEDCPYFEAETNRLYSHDECILTCIQCVHANICCRIYKYAKKENGNAQSAKESL